MKTKLNVLLVTMETLTIMDICLPKVNKEKLSPNTTRTNPWFDKTLNTVTITLTQDTPVHSRTHVKSMFKPHTSSINPIFTQRNATKQVTSLSSDIVSELRATRCPRRRSSELQH